MDNPYAPPQSNVVPATSGILSIEGKALVVPKDLTFPAICIKIGSVINLARLQKRRLNWYPPAVAILIVLVPLLFVIVGPFLRNKGTFYFHVTEDIARKRKNALKRNWCFLVCSIACYIPVVVSTESRTAAVAGLAGIVFFFAAIICGAIAARFLQAQKITATHIYLLGIPPDVQHRILELCAS